ncbi:MAG: hypothetical protein E7516_03045 [Ruminococcaceae bacterium]|nr:hypothetical protein [Oscillospiraceae bacterium]
MRTVKIDFNAENMLPDGELIGRMGEHNATHLAISPTEEMASCDEITSYVAAFVTEGRIIRTDFQPKAKEITVPVCAQLTQGHTLSVQLEAYDGKGSLVVKSPVALLRLLPSAGGDETDYDSENGGLVSQINLNILSRHSHENTSVLDNLGESGGRLTYGGEPVKTGRNIRTAEFFNSTNIINFYSEYGYSFISGENQYNSMQIFGYFLEPVSELPEGTKIDKIEIKFSEDGEYISFDSLYAENSFLPVLKMTDEAYMSPFGICFFAGFCIFGYGDSIWKKIVDDWDWYSVRITYFENTEAE